MTGRVPAHEYRISPAAGIAGELDRVARAEIDFAKSMASEFETDPVEPIHQFRKAIKRLRALVRLGRAEEADTARRIDRKLRDIGRMLGDARDAEVVRRTAIKLAAVGDGRLPAGFDLAEGASMPDQRLIHAVTDRLNNVHGELEQFIAGIEWSDQQIRVAIELEIDDAAREMRRFTESGHDEAAHDWRKRVQRCANQLRLAEAIAPILTVGQLDSLNRTAELLGDYNDLTILRWALQSSRKEDPVAANEMLYDKAEKQQSELRQLALESGASIEA